MYRETKETDESSAWIPEIAVKPLKLSQLMRIGAKLRGQAFDAGFEDREDGELLSCALFAAYEAKTGRLEADMRAVVRALKLPQKRFVHRCRRGYETMLYPLDVLIIHWNDEHHLSRARIASLLERWGL